uniref:nephronectin-like isoform X3 n=1 Tax=Scatophagus argus TaxID=75038 RepID=UPI001ED83489|nr:nephronectin-like isoform X3 [Scatophagus argus]
MLSRVVAVLLLCQHLDGDSWADRAAVSQGLCRYGNSVECCWGWSQTEWGRCEPHCQQGCKHGECVGADRCKCHPGYTGKACNQDLNECGMKPRPCKHRCMNTLGSYKCYCLDGYTTQPDGSCRNARTCYHANCQYGCEVIKGAVRCTCPSPGLRLGPDRRNCVDINECVSSGGVCPHRRKCVNTFGSFVCKCHLGFKLTYINGRYTCIDKDSRPFCSLNAASPKCRCKGGSCAVPRHPSHNQVWEFDVEPGTTAEDARDDPEVGVLRCTFEQGLCDWMSDREGDLHWEAAHNPAGGRYLFVPELKAGQTSIRGARLAVQIVPPWSHGDLCFSFSHWLTGHHVAVLQLFVRRRGGHQRYSPALWSRTGGHGWRHTQVTLTTHSVDKVLLKAERRTGRRGHVAVDDVTLRRGACR